jgi:hypothetical protein
MTRETKDNQSGSHFPANQTKSVCTCFSKAYAIEQEPYQGIHHQDATIRLVQKILFEEA